MNTLAAAAALIRTRAEAADWELTPARVDIDRKGTCDACAEYTSLVASYPEPDNEPWLCAQCAGAADYIASWHPAVALAVADLIDWHATHDVGGPSWRLAHAASAAYMGGAS